MRDVTLCVWFHRRSQNQLPLLPKDGFMYMDLRPPSKNLYCSELVLEYNQISQMGLCVFLPRSLESETLASYSRDFPHIISWYLFLPGVLLLKFLLIVDETARTKPSFLKLFLLSIFLYYGNFVMKMFLLLFDLLKQTVQFHSLLKHSVHFVRCLWRLHFSPHVFSFCLSSGRPSSMAIHTGRWWLTAPLKKT